VFRSWFCIHIFIHQFRSLEIDIEDEDLLPEVALGDFVWLDDIQADVRYEARIAKIDVYLRGPVRLAVLKISLRVPTDFDVQQGALFVLRFEVNISKLYINF
jgi:hypothetical protein